MVEMEIVAERPELMPSYETDGSAGMDLKANTDVNIIIPPFSGALVPTGLKMSIPVGHEGNMRPRSGHYRKKGLAVEGTIDSDYIGEVMIMCRNLTSCSITIEPMERIAQIVIAPFTKVKPKPVAFLKETARGEGGFGSTGR